MQKTYNKNMRRIFVKQIANEMMLETRDLHYLKNVLRLGDDVKISIFDGKQEGVAILQNEKLILKEIIKTVGEKTKIKLAVAQVKQSRMEWLVEKATEIGVDEIFILKTARVQKHIKFARFENIIKEAARQSMRISIPTIHEAQDFKKFIENLDENWCFGHIQGDISEAKNIKNIIIGPEGGWTDLELDLLKNKCMPLHLGANVLKTETAAIVGLAKLI